MATLTIRNLPDRVRDELRVRAARNGRSMEAEARTVLSSNFVAKPALTEAADKAAGRDTKAMFGRYTPKGVLASEELIAERRWRRKRGQHEGSAQHTAAPLRRANPTRRINVPGPSLTPPPFLPSFCRARRGSRDSAVLAFGALSHREFFGDRRAALRASMPSPPTNRWEIDRFADTACSIAPLHEFLAFEAGVLHIRITAAFSLADRACLATARRMDLPACTADRHVG